MSAVVSDVARAILDGTPVDWQAVESTADETERPIFEELTTSRRPLSTSIGSAAPNRHRRRRHGAIFAFSSLSAAAHLDTCSVPGIHVSTAKLR